MMSVFSLIAKLKEYARECKHGDLDDVYECFSATRPWHTTKYIVVYCRTFFAPGVYVGLEASDNFTFGELMHRVFRVLQYSQLEENGPDPRTAHAIIPPRTVILRSTTIGPPNIFRKSYLGVNPRRPTQP